MTVVAASAFEWVQAFAGVVAALAALGTLVFAYLTVRGAQTLRRDDRRVQLLDLATGYAEAGLESLGSSDAEAQTRVRIAGHRLRAAIASTGEQLPACRSLLMVMWFPPPAIGEYEQRVDAADRALTAALDEIAALRD